MLLWWSRMYTHMLGIWLTWGCKGLVFWFLRDTDHRSDGQMLPYQHLSTAPLLICASESLLKPLLSSEKSKRNIKHTLIDVLNSSGGFILQVYLFRAPVCQCPQMCQNTQVSEIDIMQLSVSNLSHHRAQSQHLICLQLSHWTEGLDWMKNQNMLQPLY